MIHITTIYTCSYVFMFMKKSKIWKEFSQWTENGEGVSRNEKPNRYASVCVERAPVRFELYHAETNGSIWWREWYTPPSKKKVMSLLSVKRPEDRWSILHYRERIGVICDHLQKHWLNFVAKDAEKDNENKRKVLDVILIVLLNTVVCQMHP